MFLIGLASAGFGVLQSTLILLFAPEEIRGRALGVLMLSIGVFPFALLVQGVAASAFGVVPTALAGGILLTVSIAAISWATPWLWRAPGWTRKHPRCLPRHGSAAPICRAPRNALLSRNAYPAAIGVAKRTLNPSGSATVNASSPSSPASIGSMIRAPIVRAICQYVSTS